MLEKVVELTGDHMTNESEMGNTADCSILRFLVAVRMKAGNTESMTTVVDVLYIGSICSNTLERELLS